MKLNELIRYKHGLSAVDHTNLNASAATAGQATQLVGVRINAQDTSVKKGLFGGRRHTLDLVPDASGTGIWVPYVAGCSIYTLVGTCGWAASGPYSGCYFEVGTIGGQVYAAHVYRAGDNEACITAWNGLDRNVLFRQKIGASKALKLTKSGVYDMPKGSSNAGTIVIAHIDKAGVEVTRIDVYTESANGMAGKVFDVSAVACENPLAKDIPLVVPRT